MQNRIIWKDTVIPITIIFALQILTRIARLFLRHVCTVFYKFWPTNHLLPFSINPPLSLTVNLWSFSVKSEKYFPELCKYISSSVCICRLYSPSASVDFQSSTVSCQSSVESCLSSCISLALSYLVFSINSVLCDYLAFSSTDTFISHQNQCNYLS